MKFLFKLLLLVFLGFAGCRSPVIQEPTMHKQSFRRFGRVLIGFSIAVNAVLIIGAAIELQKASARSQLNQLVPIPDRPPVSDPNSTRGGGS